MSVVYCTRATTIIFLVPSLISQLVMSKLEVALASQDVHHLLFFLAAAGFVQVQQGSVRIPVPGKTIWLFMQFKGL